MEAKKRMPPPPPPPVAEITILEGGEEGVAVRRRRDPFRGSDWWLNFRPFPSLNLRDRPKLTDGRAGWEGKKVGEIEKMHFFALIYSSILLGIPRWEERMPLLDERDEGFILSNGPRYPNWRVEMRTKKYGMKQRGSSCEKIIFNLLLTTYTAYAIEICTLRSIKQSRASHPVSPPPRKGNCLCSQINRPNKLGCDN